MVVCRGPLRSICYALYANHPATGRWQKSVVSTDMQERCSFSYDFIEVTASNYNNLIISVKTDTRTSVQEKG